MAGKDGRRMAARAAGQAKSAAAEAQFTATLAGLEVALRATARRHPDFAARLRERDLVAQIRLAGRRRGRAYTIRGGKVRSRAGLHPAPDLTMSFDSAEVAAAVMRPGRDYLEFIDALKNFQMRVEGPDDLAVWFSETLQMMLTAGLEFGVDAGGGVRRFTTNTNGGPVFVYVRDGRILRITPIEFDEDDAEPWTIEARGHRFTPPRKTTVSSHTLAWKSLIYSPDRLLYPMKRVDFDPDGERNPQNRGTSGYERISWDEALDLVAGEIKRVKRDHGPGAIMNGSGSHHTWGVLGYWLSARIRFFNMVGWSPVMHNPDSWEGWYWGAAHHWGQSARNGGGETYGTVEDLLKHAEMVVFWSSDPEATSGVYGAHDGTVRRQWLKDLGIPCVHIDPFHNHTAQLLGGKWIAPRPGTDSAMVAGHRPRVDDRGPVRRGVRRRADGRVRRVEGLRPRRRGRRGPGRRSGRRPRPASPRATCARSRARGGQGRRTSPPAASSASAAPAAPPPAPTGRAASSASWPCRVWASPASTWAACSRARRSTPTSSSPATPRAATRAT